MAMRQVISEQYCKLPVLVDYNSCSGKTYIVTGANNGLGLETARHLTASSADRVIMAVRNIAAGEAAKADIESTTQRRGVVQVWHLDLSSFDSVQRFANQAKNELDRIDGLIQNAGVMLDTWTVVESGMETTMAVNVISTLFLGVLMMPKLIESAKRYNLNPVMVFLVSALGFTTQAQHELAKAGGTNILKDLNDSSQQIMSERYSLSKLVEMYAVRALAEAYPFYQTRVVVNMVSPGICSTGLARDTRPLKRATQGVLRAIWARSAEEGSRTILHGIMADGSTHGKHLSGCKVKDHWIQPWMTDADGRHTQEQIWQELLALMEAAQPGCSQFS